MKKRIRRITFLLIIVIIFIIIFYPYPYKKEYKVDGYNIKVVYKNSRYYYEIDGEKVYNFEIYSKKRIKRINKIEQIKDDSFFCIVPKIKNTDTYPLCYQNNQFIDYTLIENEKMNDYYTKDKNESNKTFEYFNALSDNQIVALYNYKGFYIMSKNNVKEIKLFETDHYDNSLSVLINNKILLPNYDQKHEFNELILLDLNTLKSEIIHCKYDIDYDSYIAGYNKNNVYLFDKKYEKLYKINIKKKTVFLLDNLVKIENGKEIKATNKEYKSGITFFNKPFSNSNYSNNNNMLYKTLNDNKNISKLIVNKQVDIISYEKDNLFYVEGEDFYYYNSHDGSKKIFHYFELNFLNYKNYIYIYIYNKL